MSSCTVSKADLNGVLLANWKPQTSTCNQTKHKPTRLNNHHHSLKCFRQINHIHICCIEVSSAQALFVSPQTAAAWSFPRASGTCGPCLCLCEHPRSGLGGQRLRSARKEQKQRNHCNGQVIYVTPHTKKQFLYLLVIFIHQFTNLWLQSCDCGIKRILETAWTQ